MSETKNRRFLREKEAAQLLIDFQQKTNLDVKALLDEKKPNVEIADAQNAKVYFVNGEPFLAQIKDALVPTLLFSEALKTLPKITVNMGAISHVCNGADVLAPGVVKIEGEFKTGEYLLVVDERHQKPLAVTVALTDSETAKGLGHGKVAKNLHYVGDIVWNQIKKTP